MDAPLSFPIACCATAKPCCLANGPSVAVFLHSMLGTDESLIKVVAIGAMSQT